MFHNPGRMKFELLRLDIPGAAHFELPANVAHLDPAEAIFQAMLRGWRAQQHSRQLRDETIEARDNYVKRLNRFTNQYPWEWGASLPRRLYVVLISDQSNERSQRFAACITQSVSFANMLLT